MPMLDHTRASHAPATDAGADRDSLSAASAAEDLPAMRAELDRLRNQQRELMELLGTTRPDKVLHDVRNLLQERIFLEAACRQMEP